MSRSQRMRPRIRPIAVLGALAALLVLSACVGGVPPPSRPPADAPTSQVAIEIPATPAPASGLKYELSAGSDQPQPAPRNPVATGEPLAAADAQAILDRLPTLEPAASDVQDFAFPPDSLPAPRPGVVIQEPFPPPATPAAAPAVEVGPLEVLRYAPEGDVPLAPNLSLTFNQPMVALTGLADLGQEPPPVKLSPQPEGQWRWVGTKTLVFEPLGSAGSMAAGRFPMATQYTVEVPAGTTSATGGQLAQALTFTFTTPPPQVQTAWPVDGPVQREPLIFVAFDQRVDPQAVLDKITATAGGTAYTLRLATDAEIAADETVSRSAKQAQPGYWLAFRPAEPFAADSEITITVGPGVPSLEGPLTTTEGYTFAFRTFGPLRIVEHQCGWGSECQPFMPFNIRFSNPLDASTITPDQVTIIPDLPAATVNVWGDTIMIQGRSQGRTTYLVRLGTGIRDAFGQSLEREEELTFVVGSAQPALMASGGNMIVLDPMGKPAFTVYSINFTRLSVRAYAVTPDDWPRYMDFQQNIYQQAQLPTPPGRQVLATTINVESRADQLTETSIDLSSALPNGLGHLIVIVEPERSVLPSIFTQRGNRPPVVYAWIQGTRIGLDAFVDQGQMLAWTNDLRDGAPLAGVTLTLSSVGTATTAADGTATLPLPAGRAAQLLVAKQESDTAFLPENPYYWARENGWQQQSLLDSLRWYVFDDRGIYRPGEEVHIKGWVRRVGSGPRGDVDSVDGAVQAVTYRLTDSRGNEVLDGRADINALGGFDFSFTLTDNMNLGDTYLAFEPADVREKLDAFGHTHLFQVQEFRRPEYEVKASVVSE